jgi:hypothetical protein
VECRPNFQSRGLLHDLRDDPPTENELKMSPGSWSGQRTFESPYLQLPTSYLARIAHNFEARSGQVNEWEIPLPDELLNAIRAKLKNTK